MADSFFTEHVQIFKSLATDQKNRNTAGVEIVSWYVS